MEWLGLHDWWLEEVIGDPAYESVITPLLLDLLRPQSGDRYLDLGCGEGRVMREVARVAAGVHGVDINAELLRHAGSGVVAWLPDLPLRDDSYSGVYSVLTLEHIPDHERFFAEAARVTESGGILVVVVNHPVWTAPRSSPITDQYGEILWRPGDYFSAGLSQVRAGEGTITFHHRSMAGLLNAAADAGWSLEHMIELPHHELEDQDGIPRLMGCRWRLTRRPQIRG